MTGITHTHTCSLIYKDINEICLYEETDYLPETTSKLILRLLEIRKLTYENSAIRFQEQYFDYDGEGVFMEHPLEFFPKNPLKKYPKNYSVSGNVDEDFCSKSYPTHSDFASGIFSVGCSCQKPITMGFTLMLKGESPRNIFRILMTRQWDRSTLRGIIYRHDILGHLGVEFTSGGTTITLNLIETEQELKGSLK